MELWVDSLAVWVSRMGQFENYFDLIHILLLYIHSCKAHELATIMVLVTKAGIGPVAATNCRLYTR
jgi:hypothetical protein